MRNKSEQIKFDEMCWLYHSRKRTEMFDSSIELVRRSLFFSIVFAPAKTQKLITKRFETRTQNCWDEENEETKPFIGRRLIANRAIIWSCLCVSLSWQQHNPRRHDDSSSSSFPYLFLLFLFEATAMAHENLTRKKKFRLGTKATDTHSQSIWHWNMLERGIHSLNRQLIKWATAAEEWRTNCIAVTSASSRAQEELMSTVSSVLFSGNCREIVQISSGRWCAEFIDFIWTNENETEWRILVWRDAFSASFPFIQSATNNWIFLYCRFQLSSGRCDSFVDTRIIATFLVTQQLQLCSLALIAWQLFVVAQTFLLHLIRLRQFLLLFFLSRSFNSFFFSAAVGLSFTVTRCLLKPFSFFSCQLCLLRAAKSRHISCK